MKNKTAFFCQNCGYESPKWAGKCPACGEWNTFVEEQIVKSTATNFPQVNDPLKAKAQSIESIITIDETRYSLPDDELNRTLGGGLVTGSVVLVAGEPGIGKSTLFLQCALQWHQGKTLYVSGEESLHQIKMRADRIGIKNDQLYLLVTNDADTILKETKEIEPNWIIIDSIQTLQSNAIESAPGTVSQVRECAGILQKLAKQSNIPVTIIGHITKDGSIAGPKTLEHIVDTVLQFEGDRHYNYRILRTLKNRFGSASEMGIYEMTSHGMRGIANPSEILISQQEDDLSGTTIAAAVEGIRPLMIETQALVSQAVYGTPQRTTNGFDLRRLQLLLAVLEKRGGFQFGMKDVFFNIAGGLKMDDPSLDLSVVCALLSSYEDRPISNKICFAGEVGLSGEIRAVSRIEQRIAEAGKMGMNCILIPKANAKGLDFNKFSIDIQLVGKVEEVYHLLFQG